MSNQFIYANGYTIANARKMLKFIFGDFFFKAEKNEKELRFDIYIKNKVKSGNEILLLEDFNDLEYFNQYWNEGREKNPVFNVMVIKVDM